MNNETKSPKPRLTADMQFFRTLLSKDWHKGQRLQAEALQAEFDKPLARYQDKAREPEHVFAAVVQTDVANPRTLADCRNDYDRENIALYGMMNEVACRAMEINSTLARDACGLLSDRINGRIGYEQKEWPDSLPYQESTLIAAMRRLHAHFTKASTVTRTSGNVGCPPRGIFAWYWDIE